MTEVENGTYTRSIPLVNYMYLFVHLFRALKVLFYRGFPFPLVQSGGRKPPPRNSPFLVVSLSGRKASLWSNKSATGTHTPHHPLRVGRRVYHPPIYNPARSARRDDRRHKNNNKSIREGNGKGSTRGRTMKKRGRRGKEGGYIYISLYLLTLPSSHSSSLSLSFLLVPLSGYCIENVMLKYACTRVGPMVRNLASSFCGSTYPDVFLCTPFVLREGESVCTLLAYRWYCITSGQLTETYKDQLCASCYYNKNRGEA